MKKNEKVEVKKSFTKLTLRVTLSSIDFFFHLLLFAFKREKNKYIIYIYNKYSLKNKYIFMF